jgi:spore germination cell wall hydrolase CwlJ-like protein
MSVMPSATGRASVPAFGGELSVQGGYLPIRGAPPMTHHGFSFEKRFARGGEVDAALHAVRHHLAGGGFLSDLFSGPDYLSTGEAASPTNWGDPELASDFFKADRALRLAREAQASEPARDTPLPLRRPAPEAAPRQQVAAPPPAPAPALAQAFRPVTTLPIGDVEPHDFPPVTMPSLAFSQPVYGEKTQRLGGGEDQNKAPAVQMDYTIGNAGALWPSSGNDIQTYAGIVPEDFNEGIGNPMSVDDVRQSMMFRPEPRAEISRAVSLAQNLAPAQPEAISSAAEGPRMVNQGTPVTGGTARDIVPLSYAETPAPAPASAAIDQATGKMTNRVAEEPFAVPLTAKQGDYIARTIATESSGDPAESRAIADVILNRIRSGRFGSSPEAVLFAKSQFEPWMNPAGKNYPLKVSPKSQKYLSAQEALEEALTGGDTTGGAFNFWGPGSQFALGRSTPKFARDMPDYVDIGATRFHRPNSPIQMAQAQAQEVPTTGLFAFGTNDPNPQTALKSAQQIYENARRAGIDPVFVLPNSADPRFAPISEALKKYADERGIKYETPGYDPKDPLHITPDTAKEIAKKYPGALVGGDSNSWRLQKYGYGRPVSSQNAFVDKSTGVKLGQVGAGSPDVAKWFGQYVDRLSRGRADGGLVDDALHVVREHHADGEAVGPTMQQRLRETIASIDPERSQDQPVMDPATMGEAWNRARQNYQNFPVQEGEAVARQFTPSVRQEIGAAIAGEGGGRDYGSELRRRAAEFATGSSGLTNGMGALDFVPYAGQMLGATDIAHDIGQGDYAGAAEGAALPIAMTAAQRFAGPIGRGVSYAGEKIAEHARPIAGAVGASAALSPDEAEAGLLSKLTGKIIFPAERAKNLARFMGARHPDIPDLMYHGKAGEYVEGRNPNKFFLTPDPNFAEEFAHDAASRSVGEHPNIMPLHVSVKNPFDYDNPAHINFIKDNARISSMSPERKNEFFNELSQGDWHAIEHPDVQKLIKRNFDSFFVREMNDEGNYLKNLGIYKPDSQLKSATGNAGTFDPTKARLNEAKGGSVEDRALMLVSKQA